MRPIPLGLLAGAAWLANLGAVPLVPVSHADPRIAAARAIRDQEPPAKPEGDSGGDGGGDSGSSDGGQEEESD